MSEEGWIGVDLDGTLLTYHEWVKWNVFGESIQPMLDRVRRWLGEGRDVRIVTARVGLPHGFYDGGPLYLRKRTHRCVLTGEMFSDYDMVEAIQSRLGRLGLPLLRVQCYKDVHMIELWDDRCVQVIPNTGRTLAEEHEARYNALLGKQFGDAT